MTCTAMNTAASGLSALSSKLDVIANNLANVNTVGFKKSRANFEDVFYQVRRQPGVENSQGDISPAGIQIGLGVNLSSTQLIMTQGGIEQTGNETDLALEGTGFFKVNIYEGQGVDNVGYTRAGNFFVNPNNELVLDGNGFRLEPSITLPEGWTKLSVGLDGKVSVMEPGEAELTEVGQIELSRFTNSQGLGAIGNNIYVETLASGPPTSGFATAEGFGVIRQGALEASNVEPVRQLVGLIQTQRSFELNSQSIKTADEMLRVVGNLR
jgi:flagellar basal-body rod protein FlgG